MKPMREIKPQKIKDSIVSVPGSKSYTHRMLIAASLAEGTSRIRNWLDAQDTRYTLSALNQLGAKSSETKDFIEIAGTGGRFHPVPEPIFVGNSGTTMRLMAAVAGLGQGTYVLSGTDRMHQRPIQDLLDALQQAGISAVSSKNSGCPPITVNGGTVKGGEVFINCAISSQFLSALLLIAPLTENGLSIHVTDGPVSRPYIDMTCDIMEKFGIELSREKYRYFNVPGRQTYRPGEYEVEPDASQASYFWAAGAVTGSAVKVRGLSATSRQGDLKFVKVLSRMGCSVAYEPDGISVRGKDLCGVDVDMADMPDLVPTLSVIAAFARGKTIIRNVAHLRAKESDRLGAVAAELTKMGIEAAATDQDLVVSGGEPKGAVIETYNDHRIAMSFAVAGLLIPGMIISNPACVEKSFPRFWQVFDGLYAS